MKSLGDILGGLNLTGKKVKAYGVTDDEEKKEMVLKAVTDYLKNPPSESVHSALDKELAAKKGVAIPAGLPVAYSNEPGKITLYKSVSEHVDPVPFKNIDSIKTPPASTPGPQPDFLCDMFQSHEESYAKLQAELLKKKLLTQQEEEVKKLIAHKASLESAVQADKLAQDFLASNGPTAPPVPLGGIEKLQGEPNWATQPVSYKVAYAPPQFSKEVVKEAKEKGLLTEEILKEFLKQQEMKIALDALSPQNTAAAMEGFLKEKYEQYAPTKPVLAPVKREHANSFFYNGCLFVACQLPEDMTGIVTYHGATMAPPRMIDCKLASEELLLEMSTLAKMNGQPEAKQAASSAQPLGYTQEWARLWLSWTTFEAFRKSEVLGKHLAWAATHHSVGGSFAVGGAAKK